MGFINGFLEGVKISQHTMSSDGNHDYENSFTDENDCSWSTMAGKTCGWLCDICCEAVRRFRKQNNENQE